MAHRQGATDEPWHERDTVRLGVLGVVALAIIGLIALLTLGGSGNTDESAASTNMTETSAAPTTAPQTTIITREQAELLEEQGEIVRATLDDLRPDESSNRDVGGGIWALLLGLSVLLSAGSFRRRQT